MVCPVALGVADLVPGLLLAREVWVGNFMKVLAVVVESSEVLLPVAVVAARARPVTLTVRATVVTVFLHLSPVLLLSVVVAVAQVTMPRQCRVEQVGAVSDKPFHQLLRPLMERQTLGVGVAVLPAVGLAELAVRELSFFRCLPGQAFRSVVV
jgi:hypothetical protein